MRMITCLPWRPLKSAIRILFSQFLHTLGVRRKKISQTWPNTMNLTTLLKWILYVVTILTIFKGLLELLEILQLFILFLLDKLESIYVEFFFLIFLDKLTYIYYHMNISWNQYCDLVCLLTNVYWFSIHRAIAQGSKCCFLVISHIWGCKLLLAWGPKQYRRAIHVVWWIA